MGIFNAIFRKITQSQPYIKYMYKYATKTITQNGSNIFTHNGSRLISKQTKYKYLRGEYIPRYEILEVETNFGKGKTTVKTMYDKYSGQISKRHTTKTNENGTEIIFSDYSSDQIIYRKKDTIKYVNGKMKERIIEQNRGLENKVLKRESAKQIETETGGIIEIQKKEELAPHKKRNFIETTRTANKNGEIISKQIESNIMNATQKKELSASPYMYNFCFDNNDFAHSILISAKKTQGVNSDVKLIHFKRGFGFEDGTYSHKEKTLYLINGIKSKAKIVNIMNHELQHAHQYELIDLLNSGKTLDKSTRDLAEKYKYNFDHYYNPTKEIDGDYKKYAEQIVEKHAFAAGDNAQKEYESFIEKINNLFKQN